MFFLLIFVPHKYHCKAFFPGTARQGRCAKAISCFTFNPTQKGIATPPK
jgi:hypothetical protein